MADQVVPDCDSAGVNDPEVKGCYPQHWQHQSEVLQTYKVEEGKPEWVQLSHQFMRTMPASTTVLGITRIQNTWLWGKYISEKTRLDQKNNGKVNEMTLFHGTRMNDPKLIYGGEDGFDARLGNGGKWGRASYFAVSARYSNHFAHISADSSREIFLANVLVGEPCYLPPDSSSSLQRPPVMCVCPSSNSIMYDSVTGITHGCRVYMTYDNHKAYPAYLIKYVI